MSLMAANEKSDPSAILNGFWVTLFYIVEPVSYNVRMMFFSSAMRRRFRIA